MKSELLRAPVALVWLTVIGATLSACGGPSDELAVVQDDAAGEVEPGAAAPPAETPEPPPPAESPEPPPQTPPDPPPPTAAPPPDTEVPDDEVPDPGTPPVDPDDDFRIDLVMGDGLTTRQAEALRAAAARWSQVILQGLVDTPVDTQVLEDACGLTAAADRVEIDDLVIVATTQDIDGPGQVLGQAGPCLARSIDGAPLVGIMRFDTADLEALEEAGSLGAVLLHEMGHVLGIGTLWSDASLIANPSLPNSPDADTRFIGPHAAEVSDALIGSGSTVPVENGARRGSSDGHWRESVFGNELMTPFLNSLTGEAPLSELTVASLEDLGFYVTDRSAADPFIVSAANNAALSFVVPPTSPCQLIRPAAYVSP